MTKAIGYHWRAVAMLAGSLPLAALAADPAVEAEAPACQPSRPDGPLFISEDCSDPELNKPYVDVRRQGSITDPRSGATVDFLYVHGGFAGTDARFTYCFPAADRYRGRFFQTTYPTLGKEDAAEGCQQVGTSACSVAFAIAHGAYVVSTNNAGGVQSGSKLAAYRANAAAARYSRIVAREVYGTSDRPRGYIYGASGGAYQTVGALENTSGIWDGGVPMVFGVPDAIPNFMTVQLLALRLLKDKLPQIADAMASGGSGDPYAGLNAAESQALREVTRLGFPLRGWWQYATLNGGGFWAVVGQVRAIDPSYAEDFWTRPGYAGSDAKVRVARIVHETTVSALVGKNGLVLTELPPGDLTQAELVLTGGPEKGRVLRIRKASGNTVEVESSKGIETGTTVRIDNSWSIAMQYFQRYQPVPPGEYGFDQYRDINVRRRIAVGPILNARSAGSPASGVFHGKMIMDESAMDASAFAWSADWYRQRAIADKGAGLNDDFRLWYTDNADHGPDLFAMESGVGFEQSKGALAHIVGYIGVVEQALLYLDDWVARGAAPPATTGYRIDEDNQVVLAATVAGRHGVQPLVSLSAQTSKRSLSRDRLEAAAGRPVTFTASAELAAGAGSIVEVEWDFEGTGKFTANAKSLRSGKRIRLKAQHSFSRPGIYFPVVRVTSQRGGGAGTPFGRVQNLASVRVIVR